VDDPYDVTYPVQVKKEVGPGIIDEELGDAVVGEYEVLNNNFLDSVIVDPVVKVVEKYSYDQMVADIQSLQNRYGSNISVQVIGKSQDGRDIYDIIVGNVNAPKHILLQGGIHAREYMTPLLMMKQVETALYYYDSGSYSERKLQDMFSQVALHFIPMSNPDGSTLAQSGLSGIRSDFLKQKIMSSYVRDVAEQRISGSFDDYLKIWKSNAAGVDLNHNFPADWESIVTSATDASYAGFKGTAPLSEPESQALASVADKYPWVATISYHSMGNIIYWNAQANRVKDASLNLAQSVAQVTGYRLDGSEGKGGYKDWMQSRDNPVPGITIEVGSVSCPLPLSEFESVWQRNKAVWVQAMKWAIENNQ
jgi:g-D-glutamyl-meso-diaminopimelate peptidase